MGRSHRLSRIAGSIRWIGSPASMASPTRCSPPGGVAARTEVEALCAAIRTSPRWPNSTRSCSFVTYGFRRLQDSKIRALGFEQLFDAIHVDAIDEADRKGKQGIFKEIIDTSRLDPAEVLVVGDNPDSEIESGNRLGARTAQILRAGVSRGSNATHYIHSLAELKELMM